MHTNAHECMRMMHALDSPCVQEGEEEDDDWKGEFASLIAATGETLTSIRKFNKESRQARLEVLPLGQG